MRERILCPVCSKPFAADLDRPRADAPAFPFCSERCRLVDLGRWLDESYRISEPLPEEPPVAPDGVTAHRDESDEAAPPSPRE